MTTTEIATEDRNDNAALGGMNVPQFDNRAIRQLIEFNNIVDTVYDFANKLCRTSMAGNAYRGKPDDATAAILYGAELGLNPIQSLQQVFTVHGTPGIYARTMVALLKRRGYKFRTVESRDEQVTLTATAPDGSTETATWTIDRARTAGYVPVWDEKTNDWRKNSKGNLDGNMKYLTDPQAMLWAKAAAEVSRKLAPDVLLGIAYTIEDLESERELVRVISERVEPSPRAAVSADDILGDDVKEDPLVVEAAAEATDLPTEDTAAKPAPAKAARKPRETKQPAAPEPDADTPAAAKPSVEQLTELADVLTREGFATTEEKLDYLSKQFKRPITMPNQLTSDEVDELVGFLRTEQARDGAQ